MNEMVNLRDTDIPEMWRRLIEKEEGYIFDENNPELLKILCEDIAKTMFVGATAALVRHVDQTPVGLPFYDHHDYCFGYLVLEEVYNDRSDSYKLVWKGLWYDDQKDSFVLPSQESTNYSKNYFNENSQFHVDFETMDIQKLFTHLNTCIVSHLEKMKTGDQFYGIKIDKIFRAYLSKYGDGYRVTYMVNQSLKHGVPLSYF